MRRGTDGAAETGRYCVTEGEWMKAARLQLGLTQEEMGRWLETDGQSIRRIESDPSTKTHRTPAPRMVRLMKAYLAGWRFEREGEK